MGKTTPSSGKLFLSCLFLFCFLGGILGGGLGFSCAVLFFNFCVCVCVCGGGFLVTLIIIHSFMIYHLLLIHNIYFPFMYFS